MSWRACRGQGKFMGVGSLLPSYGFWQLPDQCTWQKVSLPTEPSLQPSLHGFDLTSPLPAYSCAFHSNFRFKKGKKILVYATVFPFNYHSHLQSSERASTLRSEESLKAALTGKFSKKDSLACDVKCRDGCDVQTGQLIPRQLMKKWSCGEQPVSAAEVY